VTYVWRFAVKRLFPVNAPLNIEHAAVLKLIAADFGLPLDAVYIGDGASGPAVFYEDNNGGHGTRCVCALDSLSWQEYRARVEAAALLARL
jgi:hypothetical protein